MIGALQSDVDESGDLFTFADRQLASDQRGDAHRLQRGQQIADSAVCLVDAIDEYEMGDAELVEHSQGRGRQCCTGRVRVDNDDRDVGDRHSASSVGREADRSWRVDDGVFLAEIAEIVEVGFRRTAPGARFLAAVTDARFVGDRPLPVGGSAGVKKCFRQASLARAGRSDQRD